MELRNKIAHLSVMWDTEEMKFTATAGKVEKVRRLAREFLNEVRIERRWVGRKKQATFCGVAV